MSPTTEFEARSLDISGSGIRFVTAIKLAPGQIITVETDQHLILANVRNCGLHGARFEIGALKIHTALKFDLPEWANKLDRNPALAVNSRLALAEESKDDLVSLPGPNDPLEDVVGAAPSTPVPAPTLPEGPHVAADPALETPTNPREEPVDPPQASIHAQQLMSATPLAFAPQPAEPVLFSVAPPGIPQPSATPTRDSDLVATRPTALTAPTQPVELDPIPAAVRLSENVEPIPPAPARRRGRWLLA